MEFNAEGLGGRVGTSAGTHREDQRARVRPSTLPRVNLGENPELIFMRPNCKEKKGIGFHSKKFTGRKPQSSFRRVARCYPV